MVDLKSRSTRNFLRGLVDLDALPLWAYLSPKKKIEARKAFEIMRVVLLMGGTAAHNLQFDTVHKDRTFRNFADLELENNRTGLVRWNKMEVVVYLSTTVCQPPRRDFGEVDFWAVSTHAARNG